MVELFISLAVTSLALPLVVRNLRRWGVVDIPNQRSSHIADIPRGGGIACLLGIFVAAIAASLRHMDVPWLAIAVATFLAIIGLIDDRNNLSAKLRLGAQLASGLIIGFSLGGPWWIFAALICIPVAVNVVNFMDGINGITSLSLLIWGFAAITAGRAQDVPALVFIGAVVSGALLAFLPWNAPAARIFLGDTGSYLLGCLVGIGILIGLEAGASPALLIAPLTIYLADTTSTLVGRLLRQENIASAHREHIYQHLVNEAGISHLRVSFFVATLSLVVTSTWVLSHALAVPVTLGVVLLYIASPRIAAHGAHDRATNAEKASRE